MNPLFHLEYWDLYWRNALYSKLHRESIQFVCQISVNFLVVLWWCYCNFCWCCSTSKHHPSTATPIPGDAVQEEISGFRGHGEDRWPVKKNDGSNYSKVPEGWSDQSESEFLRKGMILYLSPFITSNNYALWSVFIFFHCGRGRIFLILFTKRKWVVSHTDLHGNK